MTYSPHPSHYLIPASIMAGGMLLALMPKWGTLALFTMAFIALVSASSISVSLYWGAKENYWTGLASLARTLPGLTASEKEALRISAPEIGYILQAGEPVAVLAESSICPAAFFVEFLEKSGPQTSWAKRDVEPTDVDSREARRRMWDDLCHFLNRKGYLVSRPSGSDSWLWRSGAWRELYSKFVGGLHNMENEPSRPLMDLSLQEQA